MPTQNLLKILPSISSVPTFPFISPTYYKARGVDANDLIDDGDFISIEYSNKYKGFAKGYYIVVISSGDINNKEPIFLKAKKFYKSAYIKYALVNY